MNEAPSSASKLHDDLRAAEQEASSGPDDLVLVQAVQSGDRSAFAALFDRYHRRAFAIAFGVVKNKQDSLDIVQEAFIKVHRHIGNFQGSSSFYTWLYRIVMNLAIDHTRRARTQNAVDFDEKVGREEGEGVADGAFTLPRVSDGNPGTTVVRKELSQKLNAALAELPEHHRAVILLREIEGLSYEEMAAILRVPKGTIMSRLFHARRKMQELLGPYLDGDSAFIASADADGSGEES